MMRQIEMLTIYYAFPVIFFYLFDIYLHYSTVTETNGMF